MAVSSRDASPRPLQGSPTPRVLSCKECHGRRACGGQSGSRRLEGGPSGFPQRWGGEQTTHRLEVRLLGPRGPIAPSLVCCPLGFSEDDRPGHGGLSAVGWTQREPLMTAAPVEEGALVPSPSPPDLLWSALKLLEEVGFPGHCHLRAFIYMLHTLQILSYFAFCQ